MRVRDAKIGKVVQIAPHRWTDLSSVYNACALNSTYSIVGVVREGYGNDSTLLKLSPINPKVPITPFWVSAYDVCEIKNHVSLLLKTDNVNLKISFVKGDKIKFNIVFDDDLRKWLRNPRNQKIVKTNIFECVDESPYIQRIKIGCWRLPREWFIKA